MEQTPKLNGYMPRSYGDLLAVATIIAMLVSVVAWGLKLEGELNAVRAEVMDIKGQVGNGILPRAEERIRHLEEELEELNKDLDNHSH